MQIVQEKVIGELGVVRFRRSGRAKYVRVATDSAARVEVVVPAGVDFAAGEEILLSKLELVKKHQAKARQRERVRVDLRAMGAEKVRKVIREIYLRFLDMIEKHDFPVNNITFRNQKTRWGSCSSYNNISLNFKMAGLPRHLQDYILWHELMHTRHPNHGPAFWAELDKYVGDGKKYQKELRKFTPR